MTSAVADPYGRSRLRPLAFRGRYLEKAPNSHHWQPEPIPVLPLALKGVLVGVAADGNVVVAGNVSVDDVLSFDGG